MAKKTTKTIHYLRAQQDHDLFDLEAALRTILLAAPTVQETQIEQYGQLTQIMHRNMNPQNVEGNSIGGLLIHIGSGTKDEHIRTMSNRPEQQDDHGGTQAPPNGYSFLRKEAFLYIFRHHVIFCGHGFLQASAVASYLSFLSNRLGAESADIVHFDIQFKAVGNCNTLALIQQHGVKSILLDASAYQLSIDRLYQNSRSTIAKAFSKVGNVFRSELSDEELEAQSEIHINLEILLNGNSRASNEAQSLMQEQAEEIIDDETVNQGFSITTQQGEIIKPADVKLSKSVRIERYDEANSLLPNSAFTAISEYFLELQSRKLTEQ
ncbi:hypothetical protein [Neisseria weaveri]|uniref:hypothetical protein n=1 Tax=Neisseria weaveri TaxID=28091 RepID=UPI0007C9B26E|nr:hypothetical protein [Neisseria weaveri]SAY50906.1 Uncharacterised protein [Neisseria weaveri]